jgi:hypothetical protein
MHPKSLIVILIFLCQFGCVQQKAKDVQFTDTAHGKPCQLRGEDEGEITDDDREDDIAGLRKQAALMNANTVVTKGTKNKVDGFVSFFYCEKGLPIHWDNGIWFAKPLHAKKSKEQFNKAWSLCKFETHKAMIDTSHKPATRALYVGPTGYSTGNSFNDLANSANSLANTMSQTNAIELDKKNEAERDARLTEDRRTLFSECLETQGFSTYRSTAQSAEKQLNTHCPNSNNALTPCFLGDAE